MSDTGLFRALRIYNYRLWAIGALVSNVGTWMQRVAQDWLVLTILTNHSAGAMGVTMAFQFGPQLALLPLTGYVADSFNRRKLLMATQALLGLLALGLGFATVTGVITLWMVYLFALGLGCVTAFDAPTRQTFVNDLVGETYLSNAVGLNSTSFNSARMVGPAVAGLLIAVVGVGWVFLINAASFATVLGSLCLLRVHELRIADRPAHKVRGLTEGFRYVWHRPDLKTLLIMLFLIGTFGFNFPIYVSTMSVTVFHGNAGQYGLLTSALAVALTLLGLAALTFNTSTNALMQLSTEYAMRGRVMALRIAIVRGGTPLGAPIAGWVADHYGPRWSMCIGAAAGIAAAAVCLGEILHDRRRAAVPCSH